MELYEIKNGLEDARLLLDQLYVSANIEVLKRSISNSIRRYGKWTCYCHGYITNTSIGISSACKLSDKNELLEKLKFLGFTPYKSFPHDPSC